MMQVLDVAAGERLEGLRVIGFHGSVYPEHTPGLREPVLADSEGRLVSLERAESPPANPPRQRVRVRVGQPMSRGLQGPNATLLSRPWPAYWGRVVVVLGRSEQAHARALATVEPRAESPLLDEFVRWLAEPAAAPAPPQVQRLDEFVTWYCDPSQVFALYQRISRVATKEMIRAARVGQDKTLYDASWWLSRAALDDTDRVLAAVGLERSDPGMAEEYLKSTFWKKPRKKLEAELTRARGVFSSLVMAPMPDESWESSGQELEPEAPSHDLPPGMDLLDSWTPKANAEDTLTLLRECVREQASDPAAHARCVRFLKKLGDDVVEQPSRQLYKEKRFSSLHSEAAKRYADDIDPKSLLGSCISEWRPVDLMKELNELCRPPR